MNKVIVKINEKYDTQSRIVQLCINSAIFGIILMVQLVIKNTLIGGLFAYAVLNSWRYYYLLFVKTGTKVRIKTRVKN